MLDLIGRKKSALEQQLNQLTKARQNPWAPPPTTKEIRTTVQVPKINDLLDDTELQVEIPYSPTLAKLEVKSVKVKMVDANYKELVSHYFMPGHLQDEDMRKCIMTIPEKFRKNFNREYMLVAIKATKLVKWEKNLHKHEYKFDGFLRRNEMK